MTAYVIGEIKITDTDAWQHYVGQVGEIIAQYGGRVLFRGRRAEIFSGDHDTDLCVAIEFPDMDTARGWHDSPEYQALVPIREQGARVSLVSYEEIS